MSSGIVSVKRPTKFIQEPSLHLKCPVCNQLYTDPVINVKCGHSYCRTCAFSCSHCPLDNSHLDTSQLVVNRLVVSQIEDLEIYCQHGLIKSEDGEWVPDPNSCSQTLTLGTRTVHEDSCLYALVPCSNSEKCGLIQKHNLAAHLAGCTQARCPQHTKGCIFLGTPSQVNEHSRLCVFQGVSRSNGHLGQRLLEQESVVKALCKENVQLSTRVMQLEKANMEMAGQLDMHSNLVYVLQQKIEALSSRVEQLSGNRVRRQNSSSQLSLHEGVSNTNGSGHRAGSASSFRNANPGRSIERWEMPFQFKCIGTLRGHKDVVWSMTTRKGRLYSAGADGIIKIWNVEQLAKGCVSNIAAHKSVVHCLSSWGGTLISAGADTTICLWDLETNLLKSDIKDAHDNIICSMAVCDNWLFTSSFSVIKVWDLKTLEMKKSMTGMNHWVRALAVSGGKDKLYSGSHNAIHVWEIRDNFNRLTTIESDCGSVYSLAVTKTYIIAGTSGTYNQNLQLFDTETHKFVLNLCGHIGTVTTLVTSPSGRFLFSASHDSTIQMWGLEKLLPIQTLSRHQGSVNTLTLHGDFLLSGSEDHEVKVFRYFQIQ